MKFMPVSLFISFERLPLILRFLLPGVNQTKFATRITHSGMSYTRLPVKTVKAPILFI